MFAPDKSGRNCGGVGRRKEVAGTSSHWGRGYLDFGGNMLSTLQALRHFAQHLPSRNILFTSGM